MKKATKKRLALWGGTIAGLALIIWGLSAASGRYDSGTFSAEPLDLTSAASYEHTKGPDDAAVTIVEYSDFQCPFCAQAAPIVAQLLEEYPEDVRVIYRHYPLRQIHLQAQLAAEAAEAAGKQGAFWEMHDVLFANQSQWSGNPGAKNAFVTYAEALGLDVAQFEDALNDRALTQKVNAAGVTGTPTFFLNGVRLQATSYQGMVNAVELELQKLGVDRTEEDVDADMSEEDVSSEEEDASESDTQE